jgi:SAM-dependent methyltransferase
VSIARLLLIGARVTGIDVSPRLIDLARQRDPAGATAYRVADLTRPVPDLLGRFDAIGSHLALNDVADHRALAATLAALLRPGGRMALAFNNPYSSVVRGHVAGYFDASALGVYGGMSERLGGTVRYHHRTLGEYLDAFLATGLRLAKLVDVREERPFPFFMVLAFDKA